ncbi:MAG: excinuclease ABC subunit UvrA [Bacteroidales bacterium]|nr:excinuclease ABC subunit UvrA [Bacteroidales bacterium]
MGSNSELDKFNPKDFIIIKGANVHNLKNVSLAIPRYKMVVITGLSGSGKSSLAFDTLYAEGQRRYVESLSSYARQFLQRMDKPDVEYIKGLSPAIAIEQKVKSRNPRSTVGTSTEIYEFLKLLFARIGKTYSPISGNEVKRHTVKHVVDFVCKLPEDCKILILFPFSTTDKAAALKYIELLVKQGFSRLLIGNNIVSLNEVNEKPDLLDKEVKGIIVDRLIVKNCDADFNSRVADSVQSAFYEGHGECHIFFEKEKDHWQTETFSNRFELDGISFVKPSPNFFSFNNPYGACSKCEGFGSVLGIDEDLVIPNRSLSIYEGAVACWIGDKLSEYKNDFILKAYKHNFPIHKPYKDLNKEEKQLLWEGQGELFGIFDFFKFVETQAYKIQYRIIMAKYRGKTTCDECKGTRLRKDSAYVKISGKSLIDLLLMPISELYDFFTTIKLNAYDFEVSRRLLTEINSRLKYLIDVGLPYLTLNRPSNTLSGGESQRINLATSLGSNLVGAMYILDEPSIGLHPRDTFRLINILKRLKSIGNTVVVVEHDQDVIEAAENIIDIGPLAGQNGGEITFQGTFDELLAKESLTAAYIKGNMEIAVPSIRRHWKEFVQLNGARENNLKNIDIKFPLGVICAITGVSGSGKTTLIKKILYNALKREISGLSDKAGKYDTLVFDKHLITNVEMVDQNPIGKSSRSNPATYLKIFDNIRSLFSEQKLSIIRGYKPNFFSFNVPGGRCEECEGEGEVTIGMQFMADVKLKCESCGGKRFKSEILDVKYNNLNVSEILDLTVDEALGFFKSDIKKHNKIVNSLQVLSNVGLGYVKLGQSSNSLSGGEAQRIKLAYFLTMGSAKEPYLFIFDEPTTGLHFHDINKLYAAFNELIDYGHSIIVVEHNLDLIKCADWVIDLGKEGGESGGYVVFEGTPEDLVNCKESYTGKYLRKKLH